MKHSRREVGRWRMLHQSVRRRRWFEGQSRRNLRIYALRKADAYQRRSSILFAQHAEWS
ncbi:YciY family protein [Xenorhabdus sp. IM139775]|uniref:YciY family protein n=1 Tax=Xenorhabdus sp. IM139775 TaxID=3025876 RepID=UPI0023583B92|nr:YciY family protein [Xenorhabdus sp. IM139775]MDC9592356.1 YciY family protein [Xenorhabdus sp. IM139775]